MVYTLVSGYILLATTTYCQYYNIVPDPEVDPFIGNMSIRLALPVLYNTLYNVSVTQPGICGQPNQTALNYSK